MTHNFRFFSCKSAKNTKKNSASARRPPHTFSSLLTHSQHSYSYSYSVRFRFRSCLLLLLFLFLLLPYVQPTTTLGLRISGSGRHSDTATATARKKLRQTNFYLLYKKKKQKLLAARKWTINNEIENLNKTLRKKVSFLLFQ